MRAYVQVLLSRLAALAVQAAGRCGGKKGCWRVASVASPGPPPPLSLSLSVSSPFFALSLCRFLLPSLSLSLAFSFSLTPSLYPFLSRSLLLFLSPSRPCFLSLCLSLFLSLAPRTLTSSLSSRSLFHFVSFPFYFSLAYCSFLIRTISFSCSLTYEFVRVLSGAALRSHNHLLVLFFYLHITA